MLVKLPMRELPPRHIEGANTARGVACNRPAIAILADVALCLDVAIVPDHEGGRDFGVVLGGDVDPLVGLYAFIQLAGVDDFLAQLFLRHAGVCS
jgi:hypothetical protein